MTCLVCGEPGPEVHTSEPCRTFAKQRGLLRPADEREEWCEYVGEGTVIVHHDFRYVVKRNKGKDYSRTTEPWVFIVVREGTDTQETFTWYGPSIRVKS